MEKPKSETSSSKPPLTTFVQADSGSFRDVVQRLTGPAESNNATVAAAAAAAATHEAAGSTATRAVGVKRPTFKAALHERRQYSRSNMEIITKPPPPSTTLHHKPPGGAPAATPMQLPPLALDFLSMDPCYYSGQALSFFLQGSPLSTPSKCFSNLSLAEAADHHENYDIQDSSSTITMVSSASRDHDLVMSSEEEERAIKERRFYLHPSPRYGEGYAEPELLTLFPLESPKLCSES
ncbi:VQ motif-containing protein 31 [Malania oleifera]|uniref:VQ motif-containing protein 31 n=1 Tax=Malania oleifera TaxID=397392 RepID=UPI0025AE147E|nr:VQ motif-containing protein 31 [Malania oleifera]